MSKHKPAKTDSRRAQLRAEQIAQAKKQKNQRIAIIAVSVVATIALVAGIVLAVTSLSRGAGNVTAPPNANSDSSGIVTHPGKAKEGAPLVSIYLDYQCPACAQFEAAFGATLDQLAANGDITLEYRTMTFLDANLRNDSSTRAANAAACADTTGRYAEYHNAVFSHQPTNEGSGYSDEVLTKTFTQDAGITGEALDQFNACYTTKRFSGFVNKVDQEAGRAGVTGTPTVHVNGKELDRSGLSSPQSLTDAIMKMK